MQKSLRLVNCDAERAERLASEIGKVRCWLTGFYAGREVPGQLCLPVPGDDALRQIQIILKESVCLAPRKKAKHEHI